MFAITGATRLHYVKGFTDMRCGKYTLSNVIKLQLHRDPYNGDGYIFMSKDRRKMKILVYKNNLYRLYDLAYSRGYKFMRIESREGKETSQIREMEWKYLVALVNCPERKSISI